MPDLSLQKKGMRMRIYISERDRWRGRPLEAALVEALRQHGIAGATVFRGVLGYGAHSLIHTTRIEGLAGDLPLVVESIDTPEKIEAALEVVYPMVREGLITVEPVEIVKYTQRYLNPLPADKLVGEVMTQTVVTLEPEMSVQQAWRRLLENGVKAAPVVEADGRVCGILTDEDLLERAGVQQRLSVALRLDPALVKRELDSLESSPLRVRDVMSAPVVTAREGEALGLAVSRMVKFGLKRLPVVGEDGRLCGMLARLDVLRQAADAAYEAPPVSPPLGAARTLGEIMRTEVPVIGQDDDLGLVIEKFARSGSHRLVVVDEAGKAVGLLSDADIVTRVQPDRSGGILQALKRIGKPPAGKEVAGELMSPGPLTAGVEMAVVEALKLMLKEGRKWLVVVDEAGRPLGMVDRQGMLEALAGFPPPEEPPTPG